MPLQTTLELTDSQIADILHLRQLMYCKQGQLARQRKALLSKMANVNVGSIEDVGEKFSKLNLASESLQINSAEEFQIWIEFGSAYHAGVRSFCTHACIDSLQMRCFVKLHTYGTFLAP